MTPFFDTSLNHIEAMELMMCPIREESFPVTPISKRKRVTILTEPQVFALILPQSEMSDEERQQGWWQKKEYESCKMAAKNKCREIRKKGIYKTTLTEAYDQAQAATLELLTMDTTMTEESKLVQWCNDSESARGLERWCSKVHGFLRGQHVNEVKDAVVLEQARQFLCDDRDEEEIARVAQCASKRSRAFARLLGAADAVVANGFCSMKRTTSLLENVEKSSRKVMKISPSSSPCNSDGEDEELTPPIILAVR